MATLSALRQLFELFFRPARFFATTRALNRLPELLAAVYLTGMARVQDRFDYLVSRDLTIVQSDTLFMRLSSSWPRTWQVLILAGVLAGGLGWLIGGWWYGARLRLSGAPGGVEREGRLTWAYVALVSSLPVVLLLLIDTARYDTYLEAYQRPMDPLVAIVTALILWSPWVSYRAATTRFPIDARKAAFWFFAVPLLFQLTMLVLFGPIAVLIARG